MARFGNRNAAGPHRTPVIRSETLHPFVPGHVAADVRGGALHMCAECGRAKNAPRHRNQQVTTREDEEAGETPDPVTRLRDAINFDAIPALLVFADDNAGVRVTIAKLRAILAASPGARYDVPDVDERLRLASAPIPEPDPGGEDHEHHWIDAPDDETGWFCTICRVTEYPTEPPFGADPR